MKRFLIILLVLVIVLAGAGTALLTDANIKRFTESWLSENMARQISVDGAFSVNLGNPLRLTAESVRLANPDWAKNPVMLKADQVQVAIDLATILGDAPLILTALTIRNLDGELVSNAEGRNNWTFGSDNDGSSANFLIQELEVTAAKLEVRRYELEAVAFEIDTLKQVENAAGLLQTSLAGKYNKRPVSAQGQVGPFRNLLDGTNVRFALDASIGTLKINGSGTIDDLDNPRQPKLKLAISAPDAGEVVDMLGFKVTASGDIDLTADISPVDVGVHFTAGGRWGQTKVDVKGRARDLPTLDGISLSATGDGPDLRSALRLFGVRGAPDAAFKFSGDLTRDGKDLDIKELDATIGNFLFKLTGDMNRFPSLNDADLKLSVTGDDVARFREVFGLPGVAKGEFSLDGSLGRSPSGQDQFQVNARTELGTATLAGTLGTAPDYVGTLASLRGDGENFRHLAELLGVSGLTAQPFTLSAELEVMQDGYQLKDGTAIKIGAASMHVSGLLGPDPLVQGTTLDWDLSGVDIADLARVAELKQEFPSSALTATGTTQVRPADFVFSDVKGTIDQADFTVGGQLGRAEDRRGTDLRVSMRGPELERLAFLLGDVNLPAGPFTVSGRVQRTDGGLRVSESLIDVAGASGKMDGELALPLDTLKGKFDIEVSGPDVSAFWEGRYDVVFGKQPFAVDLRGEVTDELWQLDDGQLKIGQTELTATGAIRRTGDSGKLNIQAKSPYVERLGTIMGIELLPGRSLELSGALERRGDTLTMSNFLGRTNKGNLAGNISYTFGTPPSLKATLTSTLLDLTWITDPAKKEILEDKPAREAEQRKDGRLIPDWELPLEGMKRLNVDLSIAADEVLRQQLDVKNWYLKVVLQDGALAVAPWRFGGDSGSLDVALQVTPAADGADVSLRVKGVDLVTGLLQPDNADLSMMPKGDWDINVTTRGKTLRDLATNLDGTGKVHSASGRLENSQATSALFGNLFSSIVGAVNPFARKEPYTEITCAVFPFTFKDGVMTSAPSVVVQTDKLNIISRGDVNLQTERLDLSFNSKPRSRLSVSAGSLVNPFVRIGGTMAEPAVTLDRTGAALTAGAAFFTAGLSLLAQAAFDSAWRSPDPCGKVVEEAEKRFAKKNGGK